MKIDGGNLLGKIIILSFSDNENTLYSSIISVLASVADFSTVAASTDAPLLFGSLQIDPQRRLVWQAGQTVDLTPMEFDILLLLARRPGQVGAFMLFRLICYCCLFHLRRCRQFRHCQKCRFLQFSSPSFFQAPLHTKFLVGAFSRRSPPPRSAGCRR